jgi:integrase
MAQSIKAGAGAKPEKPRKDFPLFAHRSGQWAKKVRGEMKYFGVWADPAAALDKWLDEKDDLYAGRRPTGRKSGITVADLLNRFRHAKEHLAATGEITARTLGCYIVTCDRLAKFLSRRQLVETLTPSDFEKLRADLAKGRSPVTLRGDIMTTRMVMKYAYDSELISKPASYGQSFRAPSKTALKRVRQSRPKRLFSAPELRRILKAASQPLRAMILLGINCGLGASDLAHMPQAALDLKRRWLDYPRVKTAVDRRCPLWPETVSAVKEAIASRPRPRDPADEILVFLTRCGQRWARTSPRGGAIDAVGCAMNKLLKELGIHRPGVCFYALRHTLQTIGGEARDQIALNLIFGHADHTMADPYRESLPDDSRLLAVSNHVRKWLFPHALASK